MTDFLPPQEMTLEEAVQAMTRALALRDGGPRETDRTFYDTFDGLLYRAGRFAVHERGRLALLERDSGGEGTSGQEWTSLSIPRPERALLAHELEPGPLRAALSSVAGVRALLPLVHVHSHVRSLGVLDGERKTVVRLTLEAPALVSSGGCHRALPPRLRVAVVRGYDEQFARVLDVLERELGFRRAERPLVDEAVTAAGGEPGGTSSKIDVPLSSEQRAGEAAAAMLRRLLEVIEANFDGATADVDSEFLHDFRVSVRRTRAVQRELEAVFPSTELARFRAEFRWLQEVTGEARDLDVYVLGFDSMRELVPESMRAELQPLLGVLRSRRLIARREMVRALRSEPDASLLADWGSFLERLGRLSDDGRPDAGRPIAVVAGERTRKLYRRMVKMGRAIDSTSPPEAYHELRKKGKELRYMLELFGASLYPSDVVGPMIKSLKSLQDTLGRHQDREVQVGVLRLLRNEVAALPDGPGALMAMGVLVDRLSEDERTARRQFAERFAAFASKAQRKLVKETFG